jgi:hypothetical protein
MEGLYWRSFAFIRGSSSQKWFFADFDSTPTPNADIAFLKSWSANERKFLIPIRVYLRSFADKKIKKGLRQCLARG